MTRSELVERLAAVKERLEDTNSDSRAVLMVDRLVEDIEADGVLDVQAPEDIAEDLKLPRPAKKDTQ